MTWLESSPSLLMLARAGVAITLATIGGAVAIGRRPTHNQLCTLISYAAGALLIVTLTDLLPVAYQALGLIRACFGIVIGYALFVVISRYVAHVCPACAASHTETVFRQVTWVMVIALSIHCVMDGLALAASGGSLAIAVFVHKVPEGLALTGVALAAGWNPWRALGLTFLIEAATTVAGVSVGMFTHVQVSPVWLGWVMAHVSGGFLFLAGHAIINELMRHRPRATTIAATLGALTLLVLQWLVVGDTHAH